MNLSHILAAVFSEPWAIDGRKGEAIARVVLRRAAGDRLSASEVETSIGDERAALNERLIAADRLNASRSGVAVVPMLGTLVHRGAMDNSSGMTSTELVAAKLRAAEADPNVGTIVLDVDSPGGEVAGTPELASLVASLSKPVVAVANSWAGSAAYWIASQADEVVVTPSGQVGSIGVLIMHHDDTKALEAEGITQTVIAAGEFKAELWGPLTDAARAELERRAQETYVDFVASVAKGRGVAPALVRERFGKGRMVSARDALDAGMVDRVATLQDTIGRLLAGGRVRRRESRAEAPGEVRVAASGDVLDLRRRALELE